MRQFLTGVAIAASMLAAQIAPVAAQNLFEPIVYVNDSAVTRYELDQRIRFLELLGAPGSDPEAARQALIDDRLRMQAAADLGIEVTEEGLQVGLDEFAQRAGLDAAQFTAQIERSGVDREVFRDFVEAGVAWRAVIGQRLLAQVTVSESEVDQELKRVIETPIVTSVLLSEIIIPAPEGQEESAMGIGQSIVAGAPAEAVFAASARQYSASGSASQGGRLDWVALANLPPSLRPIIMSLQPGQATQPLSVPGAVVIFFLRDTRGTLRPGAREQVLDYMSIRLASAGDAAVLAAKARSCDDLYVQAGPQIAPLILRQTASQGAIPALIATQLASLDANEAAVVSYGGSADLVMLCSREPALLAAAEADVPTTAAPPDAVEAAVPDRDGIPDREIVRDRLFNQKASNLADAYLAELRADAIIRQP